MKRIYPRFIIGLGLSIFIFFMGGLIAFWNDASFFRRIQGILLVAVILYAVFTTKIEYDDDYMYICAGWNKVKVYYRDIVAVYSAANPFGYWLKSYDTRERKFILAFPLEHKKLRELFTAIEKVNPSVQIDVWWYKNQPASNNLKTALKVGLFIIAIFAADFLFHYLTKR